MKQQLRGSLIACTLVVAVFPAVSQAQVEPWDSFQDSASNSVCSLVNAGNAELVVLRSTGQLVSVGGSDVILEDTFVDAQGFVFFEDGPAGLLDFATDGDGFRTLWWLTLTGTAIEIDPLTGEPQGGDSFPDDFEDVPCDACDFWDDPSVCEVPPPTVDICGAGIPLVFPASLVGLTGLSSLRRTRLW
jgi:hypothetical protein